MGRFCAEINGPPLVLEIGILTRGRGREEGGHAVNVLQSTLTFLIPRLLVKGFFKE